MSEELQKEACAYLDSQKEIYDEIFGRIGLSYEVVFLGANEFVYNSGDSDTDTWMYEPWYKKLLAGLLEGEEGEVQFSRTFSAQNQGKTIYQFAAGRLLGEGE